MAMLDNPLTETALTHSTAPVIERVFELDFEPLPTEQFGGKLETWKTVVKKFYPRVETIPHWKFNIPTKNGAPDFSAIAIELQLQHRLWQGTVANKTWCMQCRPNKLVFNVNREKDNLHSYDELKSEASVWIPRWSSHFGVTQFTRVALGYVNQLDAVLTPQFCAKDKGEVRISVDRAIKLFSAIPVGLPIKSIVPPYDCKVTILLDSPLPGKLSINLKGLEDQPAVRVFLRFASNQAAALDCQTALNALDRAHEILGVAFRNLFTPTALASFGLK